MSGQWTVDRSDFMKCCQFTCFMVRIEPGCSAISLLYYQHKPQVFDTINHITVCLCL